MRPDIMQSGPLIAPTLTGAGECPPEDGRLRQGALGVAMITFFVISAAGPLVAIAGGVPLGMLFGNGAGAPATYAVASLLLLVFAVGYTMMAREVRNCGGFYAFSAKGLGGIAGGASAMVAVVGYNLMQIGLYGMLGAAASSLLPLPLPWWAYSYAAMAAIAMLGYRQVDLSARVLSVCVIAEYAAVLLLDVIILLHGGATGLDASSFSPSIALSGAPVIGMLFAFAAFIGFEATTIYSEEARDPDRTIPIATFASILLIGVFYTFSTWCMVEGAGSASLGAKLHALTDPTGFLFLLSDAYAGRPLTLVLRILFVTSVFSGLLAFHNAVARYLYVLGRERLLHQQLGRVHRVHASPHAGSFTQSAVAFAVVTVFVICGANPVLALFNWLTNLAALSVLTLMAVASFAVIGFFRRRGEAASTLRTLICPLLSAIVLCAITLAAIWHFDILIGHGGALARILPAAVPCAAVIGGCAAWRLKRRDPARFARLGEAVEIASDSLLRDQAAEHRAAAVA